MSHSRNFGGRPQEFDRDAAVAAAMIAFWHHGYKATTVAFLEEVTGVDRSTLYQSFGGKDGLYKSSADLYLTGVGEQLSCHLHDGTDGVLGFIDTMSASLEASGKPRGCFVVNDMANVDAHIAADRYFDMLLSGFRAALGRAASSGRMDEDMIESRAQFLAAAIIGISLTDRTMGAEVAHRLIDGVRSEVAAWFSD